MVHAVAHTQGARRGGRQVPRLSALQICRELLLDLDRLGQRCFAGGFMLVLLPLTISDRAPNGYHMPYIIAMFVAGGVLLLPWPFVEMRVRPLLQLRTFCLNPNTLEPTAIYFVHEVAYAFVSVPMLQWSEITLGLSAGNATIADLGYAHGFTALAAGPLGSPIRTAVMAAWSENMRRLLTGGLAIAGFNIISTLFLPNNILTREKQARATRRLCPR